jgi:hypothetical protein
MTTRTDEFSRYVRAIPSAIDAGAGEAQRQGHDVLGQRLTRRRLLGAAGMGGLALLSEPAWAQTTVDLQAPGGPSTRPITTAYPQKGPMILQRTSPPWLETPFENFDRASSRRMTSTM